MSLFFFVGITGVETKIFTIFFICMRVLKYLDDRLIEEFVRKKHELK